MIKHKRHIIFLVPLFWAMHVGLAHAQFINLQVKVEPELSATVEQPLDFGTQVTNSGQTAINLGDLNMGIFSIRAFSNQLVFVELEYPDYLSLTDGNDTIPMYLELSYNNSNENVYANARPLPENNGLIKISEHDNSEGLWSILYIYVFGSIDVGNVANGLYTGDIVLSVDYE